MSDELLSFSVSLLISVSCFVCISHRRHHRLVRYICITLYAMEPSGGFLLYNDSFNIWLQWHQTVPNVIQGHKWHKSDPIINLILSKEMQFEQSILRSSVQEWHSSQKSWYSVPALYSESRVMPFPPEFVLYYRCHGNQMHGLQGHNESSPNAPFYNYLSDKC